MGQKELSATRFHYGYRRLHIRLKREGWEFNAKRIDRLCTEARLSLRSTTPKLRVSCRRREHCPEATRIDDCWAMDSCPMSSLTTALSMLAFWLMLRFPGFSLGNRDFIDPGLGS